VKTVVVATATNILVASAWRDLLRSAGIEAEITGGNWESLFPMMSQLACIAVLVPEADAGRARGLIDEMERSVAESGGDDPADGEGDSEGDEDDPDGRGDPGGGRGTPSAR
jgi:hypothetical protein